jgi:hypothetical protein
MDTLLVSEPVEQVTESVPPSEARPAPEGESGELSAHPAVPNEPSPAAPSDVVWKSTLPEDIKNDPSLSHIKDVETLAKSYVHAQKMIGADKVLVPGKHATEQEWQDLFRKLGLPESEDKYELQVGEDADKELLAGFKKQAMEAGVLPKQAQKIVDWLNTQGKARAEQEAQAAEAQALESRQMLEKEWGEEFNKNLSAARAVLREYADEDFVNYLNETGLANDPKLVKLFSRIGGNLLEESIKGNRATAFEHPEQVQQRVNSILSDPKHPYNDASHPNHAAAVKEVSAMYERMYGAE